MRTETRTVTIMSMEEYFAWCKENGRCPLCDGAAPHDEQGCPTFMEAE